MALVSDLVSAIADAEGAPEASGIVVARLLREAGLVSTGARGRHAPHASVGDAVNLLLGINATAALKDAPRTVRLYRDLVCHIAHVPAAGYPLASKGETLATVLERIVADLMEGGPLDGYLVAQAARVIAPDRDEAIARSLLLGPDVTLDVGLARPQARAFVRLSRAAPRPEATSARETLASIEFRQSDYADHAPAYGDRRDQTTIGLRTLLRVAEAIR